MGCHIEPTEQLKYIKGLRAALKSIGATQSDQYSWIAKVDNTYVFTAEIDHKNKERNQYSHKNGIFNKTVRPLSTNNGDAPQTVRHGEELYNAVADAYQNKLRCILLLVKGTKYGTSEGGVKGAIDGDAWVVSSLSGSISDGFSFTLERTA